MLAFTTVVIVFSSRGKGSYCIAQGSILLFHGPMTRSPEPRDYLRSPSFHYLHGAETKQKDEPMVNRNRRDSLGAPSIPVLRMVSELLQ